MIKRRFPTIEHMKMAGILTQEELYELAHTHTPHGNWLVTVAEVIVCLGVLWSFDLSLSLQVGAGAVVLPVGDESASGESNHG